MGEYEKRLYKLVNSGGFVRCFHGTCKGCGTKIWSIGEEIDVEGGKIKALFVCNCGKKYKEIVYERNAKDYKGYKYHQGLLADIPTKKDGIKKGLKGREGIFLVLEDKVLVKKEK